MAAEQELRWCRRGDLNPYALAGTSPSNRPKVSSQSALMTFFLVVDSERSTALVSVTSNPVRCLAGD